MISTFEHCDLCMTSSARAKRSSGNTCHPGKNGCIGRKLGVSPISLAAAYEEMRTIDIVIAGLNLRREFTGKYPAGWERNAKGIKRQKDTWRAKKKIPWKTRFQLMKYC